MVEQPLQRIDLPDVAIEVHLEHPERVRRGEGAGDRVAKERLRESRGSAPVTQARSPA
jgi:hypothetical protein